MVNILWPKMVKATDLSNSGFVQFVLAALAAGVVFANPGRWTGGVSSYVICLGNTARTMTA